ncbi:MAG: TIM barrel protein [Planctomycetales bacterium]
MGLHLGMVTYMWGADWDLPTIIKNCTQTGFEAVELRTTHKHGVEPSLTKEQRADVRKCFADSPVKCIGLGSACDFHSADHGVVQQNIDLTKKFVELSADVGGTGVKVRPNGFVKGVEQKQTIEQIGKSLRECAEFAKGYGQEIRLEVHGKATSDPAVIRQIMDVADHPQAVVCWNSNSGETIGGSIAHNFNLLKHKLGMTTHINTLWNPDYPYRELFKLLQAQNYPGYCLSESPATTDPIQVMKYYKALFTALCS